MCHISYTTFRLYLIVFLSLIYRFPFKVCFLYREITSVTQKIISKQIAFVQIHQEHQISTEIISKHSPPGDCAIALAYLPPRKKLLVKTSTCCLRLPRGRSRSRAPHRLPPMGAPLAHFSPSHPSPFFTPSPPPRSGLILKWAKLIAYFLQNYRLKYFFLLCSNTLCPM